MQIRTLEAVDAKSYRKVRLDALKYHPEAFSSSFEEENEVSLENFQNRLRGVHSFTFGAFDQEVLCGVVTLVMETKNKLKHRANIVAMYVSPEYRKTGIGRRLLAEAINKAREIAGIEQLHLGVSATNEPAKRLYASLGFVTYGVEIRALKIDNRYIDEEFMVLFL